MSGRALLFISIARIATCDSMHQRSKRPIAHLNQAMEVVCHPAIDVQSSPFALQRFRNDLVEHVAVLMRIKQRLPAITAQDDVIVPARHVQSWKSWHPCSTRTRNDRTTILILQNPDSHPD